MLPLAHCLWLTACSHSQPTPSITGGKATKVLLFLTEWSYKDVQVIPQLLHQKKRFDIGLYLLSVCHYPAKDLYAHVFMHLIHCASNSKMLAVFLCIALHAHQQSNKVYFFVSTEKQNEKKQSVHYYPLVHPCSFFHAPRMHNLRGLPMLRVWPYNYISEQRYLSKWSLLSWWCCSSLLFTLQNNTNKMRAPFFSLRFFFLLGCIILTSKLRQLREGAFNLLQWLTKLLHC